MLGSCEGTTENTTDEGKALTVGSGSVAEELKTFGEKCKHFLTRNRSYSLHDSPALPVFLADEKERDTTRYINLTTIATFFSSVTATTLQFTYAPLQSEASDSLRGVVILFWFLSLVFSVSSGVSSLLGLTWRKSAMYVMSYIFIIFRG